MTPIQIYEDCSGNVLGAVRFGFLKGNYSQENIEKALSAYNIEMRKRAKPELDMSFFSKEQEQQDWVRTRK